MTKLIQVAKELNVGLSTLVEYLTHKGYEVENKPTAKITDEMHTELLKEFQKSIDIKERAKQINIGGRGKAGEGDNHDSDIFKVKPPAPQVAPTPEPKEAAPEPELTAEEETPRIKLARPTVLGKIDLSGRLQQRAKGKDTKPATAPAEKPTPEPPAAEPEPEPEKLVAKSPVVEEPIAPPVATPTPPAAVSPTDTPQPTPAEKTGPDNFRAETPELRGLKILGKIDTDQFERKKKKKPAEPPAKPAAAGTPAGTPKSGSTDDSADKKRKRKRKKVTVEGNNTNRPAGGGGNDRTSQGPGGPPQRRPQGGSSSGNRPGSNQRDDVKEVSKKEIEDQIKATMARLSGGGKRKRQKLQRDKRDRFRERQELIEQEQASGNLELTEFVSVQELANLLDVPVTDVITVCLNLGVIVSINQRLDAEIIELVANEFGHEVSFISVEELADDEVEDEDDPADLEPRAPIVTVMGHVDHGKTSLLDYIRSAKVASGEAGGITQHIGAYEVVLEGDRKITFLDTPGHEAFTAMRARGAKVTDIAIIIIAADDSIMPQTREAISHAQAAGVPIVFAINKIDKTGAQPEKIKQELASMNFLVEEWGGKYQSQDISAKTGVGIAELLEKILLEAELLEVKANPSRAAFGTVIEASLDKGRGYVTKLLVQNGSLAIGDSLVAGEYAGKVRAMLNERGKRVKEVGPSTPVLVLGLSGAPQAGDRFKVVDSDQEARQIASKRAQISREQANRATKRISLDEIGRRLALGSFKELNLIVKGDVDGSIEALSDSLIKLSIESVQVNVIHKAVGGIIESDVLLASASDAIIIGFQVRPSAGARKLAEKEGVEIKTYSIIYEAINEVKSAIEGMLEPTKQENITGQVEVREVYKISKIGTVAGCIVQEGKITRNNHVRLVRDGIVVFPTRENTHGEIASLKRFKDDVKEVRNGLECGISIKNFNDIKVGDIIEAYEITEIRQKLD